MPLLDYYTKQDKLIKINGVGKIDDITGEIFQAIHSRSEK